jgi:hypothetical protein
MQDLSDAGKQILPQSIPNSGTADRRQMLELGGALLALGGGHALGFSVPMVVAGGTAAGLASAPGNAIVRYLAAGGNPQNRAALAEIIGRGGVGALAREHVIENQRGN